MTTEEHREIDARVAFLFGWRCFRHTSGEGTSVFPPGVRTSATVVDSFDPEDFQGKGSYPFYTLVPAAADLVRLEIVRRWDRYSETRQYIAFMGVGYRCAIPIPGFETVEADHEELFVARALVFLSAVETTKPEVAA